MWRSLSLRWPAVCWKTAVWISSSPPHRFAAAGVRFRRDPLWKISPQNQNMSTWRQWVLNSNTNVIRVHPHGEDECQWEMLQQSIQVWNILVGKNLKVYCMSSCSLFYSWFIFLVRAEWLLKWLYICSPFFFFVYTAFACEVFIFHFTRVNRLHFTKGDINPHLKGLTNKRIYIQTYCMCVYIYI